MYAWPVENESIIEAGVRLIESGFAVALGPYKEKGYAFKNPQPLTAHELRLHMRERLYSLVLKLGPQLDGTCVMAVDCDSPSALAWAEKSVRSPMINVTSRGLHYLMRHMIGEPKNRPKVPECGGADILFNGSLQVPPSIHPSGWRYHWKNGIIRPSALELFDPTFLPARKAMPPPVVEICENRPLLQKRLRGYLRKAGPAVSGQGGHAKTFRLCYFALKELGLTIDEAWPEFVEWNLTCVEPWSEFDLLRKLKEAHKKVFGG